MAACDNTQFRQFCTEQGLTELTISVLERCGYTTLSTFRELTVEDIDQEDDFKKLTLRDRRRLQAVLKQERERASKTVDIWEDTDEKEDQDELRIVLVGKTGCGKSSTGNTILNKTRDNGGFRNQGGQAAVTVRSQRRSIKICDRKIRVIDTPGVYDPTRDWDEVAHEIVRCLCLTAPGPHVLLFVIRGNDRFTQEEYDAYYKVKAMFSNHINNYIIIVFTRGDELAKEGLTLDEVLAKAKEDVQLSRDRRMSKKENVPDVGEVLTDVNNRKILFNNDAPSADKARQVAELLNLIDEMINNNGDQPYYKDEITKKVWEMTEKELKRIMAEHKVDKREAMAIHQENLKKAEELKKKERQDFISRVKAGVCGAGVGGVAVAGGAALLGAALAPATVAVAGTAAVVGGASYAAKKVCSLM